MDPTLIAALLSASFITDDTAQQLGALGDLPADRVEQVRDALRGEVTRLLGDDDGDPVEAPTDDTLAASGHVIDGIDALDAELTRRSTARSAVLARVRPPAPEGSPAASGVSRPAAKLGPAPASSPSARRSPPPAAPCEATT